MTQAATEFIQPLTLQVLSQNPVHLDVMKEPYPDQVNHIELGKKQIYLSWYLQLLTLLQN
ncbi:flavoprotein [Streptococcus pneumoniae GA16531]|nr:flavoprotein [Streptococcus pneumoniae GA16531]EHZ22442.1 hypothetical protein SPAR33_1255 [Streptococcus pneumoniae GA13723]